MAALELRVPPLAVLGLAVALLAGMEWLAPSPGGVPLGLRPALTTLLVLSGAAVALSGVLSFRRQRTTVNPLSPDQASSLVCSGIYRFSRNPMYLGFLLLLGAAAAWLSSLHALWLMPAFVLYLNRFQIEPEERALAARFGAEFSAYRQRVRRWI
ncbi:methyltransferase family protein [Pseudomarimonas salicorniae]|uniref:Isoprenylcysteine carboxylmethyltransferase family protein n=1 Tax=Pseudomarimonas salicorniae TaxID=2933270 RepID=A0ABT0GM24_9GAMM|nr:isoprenylcysteine carboxylmethyltransferase family protein [Lysobacter sp. CAU 1642]MCK7595599.1 isoprenylcysteine carboxylmethyltransferase family protein [Lysobacter sp. CAU 1642]